MSKEEFLNYIIDFAMDAEWGDLKRNDTYVTPVPGGVGLLTRLTLMQNVVDAYKVQKMKG